MRRPEALQGVRMAMFLNLLQRWEQAELNQEEAAELLGIDVRIFRPWMRRYRQPSFDAASTGAWPAPLARAASSGQCALRIRAGRDRRFRRRGARNADFRSGRPSAGLVRLRQRQDRNFPLLSQPTVRRHLSAALAILRRGAEGMRKIWACGRPRLGQLDRLAAHPDHLPLLSAGLSFAEPLVRTALDRTRPPQIGPGRKFLLEMIIERVLIAWPSRPRCSPTS